MQCIKCGNDNEDSAVFCSRCGVNLSAAATSGGIENMSVVRLVVYTFLTAGIYAPIWLMKRLDVLNAFKSEMKITQGSIGIIFALAIVNVGVMVYAVVVVVGSGMELDLEGPFMSNIMRTSNMLDMAFKLMLLFQCIKARSILIDHMNATGNRGSEEISFFYMILWGLFVPAVFYLQYKINRIDLSVKRGGFNGGKDIYNA